MDIRGVQSQIQADYSQVIQPLSLDHGVARLLVQTGQLGEAVLHNGDVAKELADVMFVLMNIAIRCNVDLDAAVERHIRGRPSQDIIARINKA
jgi:NTP pyrophosphatase (non-canonical NTP hydrolase)